MESSFLCLRCKCTISPSSCISRQKRQRKFRKPRTQQDILIGKSYIGCHDCEQGTEVRLKIKQSFRKEKL